MNENCKHYWRQELKYFKRNGLFTESFGVYEVQRCEKCNLVKRI